MSKTILFLLSGLFMSCANSFSEKEVIGKYTPIGYQNNFDTITLKPQGVYYRKVYDKNRKLLLNLKSRWELREIQIFLHSFYLNLDDDLVSFPGLITDTTSGNLINLDKSHGTIKFCVGYFSADLPDQNCYQKIR